MSNSKLDLQDLLAVRDGDPVDAQVLAAAEQEHRQTLAALIEIRAGLQRLPDVPMDHQVWQSAVPESPPAKSGWLRFPLATAAAVCLMSAVLVVQLINRPLEESGTLPSAAVAGGSGFELAGLMAQSLDIEQRLRSGANNALNQADASVRESIAEQSNPSAERAVLFLLADVDAQIAALYELPQMDDAQRLSLWQQRVVLLESLLALRGMDEQPEQLRSL